MRPPGEGLARHRPGCEKKAARSVAGAAARQESIGQESGRVSVSTKHLAKSTEPPLRLRCSDGNSGQQGDSIESSSGMSCPQR